jgi:hypothetical protein
MQYSMLSTSITRKAPAPTVRGRGRVSSTAAEVVDAPAKRPPPGRASAASTRRSRSTCATWSTRAWSTYCRDEFVRSVDALCRSACWPTASPDRRCIGTGAACPSDDPKPALGSSCSAMRFAGVGHDETEKGAGSRLNADPYVAPGLDPTRRLRLGFRMRAGGSSVDS